MIISRTPLRITLGGGGTDLPSFYEREGGLVLSAAINRYIYVMLNRTFSGDYLLKYSALERVSRVDDIQHPIIRAALRRHDVGPALELVSVADIPAGTGLGSSGAFTVGLLKALYSFKREHAVASAIAEEACDIEIHDLNRPVGKQDQYIAAVGGVTEFGIAKDGRVAIKALDISNETRHDLEEHLLLFFTGYARDADAVLEDQRSRSSAGDEGMIANLRYVKELGQATKVALEAGKTREFAELMDLHWAHKQERSKGMSSPSINRWYELGKASGAIGGKLVGAGAGGFLLFYTLAPADLRKVMVAEGLAEVRFSFDHDGTALVARD